jgi:hypothetical protein
MALYTDLPLDFRLWGKALGADEALCWRAQPGQSFAVDHSLPVKRDKTRWSGFESIAGLLSL